MTEQKLDHLPVDKWWALQREELLSQGRHKAFLFALKCEGDLSCLQTEIQESEDLIVQGKDNPKGPMAPNASPRVYQDGYLTGLKDALEILTTNGESSKDQPRVSTEPSKPTVKRRKAVAEKDARYTTRTRRRTPRQRKT